MKPYLGTKIDIKVTRLNLFTHARPYKRPVFKVAAEVDKKTEEFINIIRYTIIL